MTYNTPYRPEDLINLVDFPIHQNGPERDALLSEVHAQLAADGCAVLKRFLTERAITLLTEEADSVASCAHRPSIAQTLISRWMTRCLTLRIRAAAFMTVQTLSSRQIILYQRVHCV